MHSKLRKIIALSSFALLLAACGDDSSSKAVYTEKAFESLNDLPQCNESLGKMVAVVGNDRYLCLASGWTKIDGYVKGVCNLDLCDADHAGQYFYSKASKDIYQCYLGTWKTLDGAGIADADYVDCALEVLVKDTVTQKDDLKACDRNHDGNLALVENDFYACSNKEWVKLGGEVITEANLPGCLNEGQYVFVLSKMSAYLCKNGVWNKDGIVVDVKSSAAEPLSSSSAPKSADSKSSSSKKVVPESSSEVVPVESSSSAPWTDDTTKVRGMCIPSKGNAEKGEEIRWMFINMGGTPVSFEWLFSSNNPIESSNNMGPSITYTRGGLYKATLVVNKGLPSESDEIVCSNLNVLGDIPISGCTCTTTAKPGSASETSPYAGEWKVTGCEGGEPFSYEWGNGAFGEDSVVISATAKQGNYAPVVTVYNDDGVSMSPTCPTVYTFAPLKMSCSIDDFMANIQVSNYPSGQYGEPAVDEIPLEYIIDGGEPTPMRLTSGYNGWPYNSTGYSTYNQFHELLVFEGGDLICSAFTHLRCNSSQYSAQRGDKISWSLSSLQGFEVKSVSWTFTDGNGDTTSSKERIPENNFQTFGTVRATALINEGLPYEHSVSCYMDVDYPPVTGCECGAAELVSDTNDLAFSEDVRYKWKVTGCTTAKDAGELTYDWENKYSMASKLDEESSNTETFVFSDSGSYRMYVKVKNKYGEYERVTCPVVRVEKSIVESSSSVEVESSSSENVESSSSEEPVESSSSEPVPSSSEEPESSSSEDVESSSSEEPVESSSSEPIPSSSAEPESSSSEELPVESSSSAEPEPESTSSEIIDDSSSSEVAPNSSEDGEI